MILAADWHGSAGAAGFLRVMQVHLAGPAGNALPLIASTMILLTFSSCMAQNDDVLLMPWIFMLLLPPALEVLLCCQLTRMPEHRQKHQGRSRERWPGWWTQHRL